MPRKDLYHDTVINALFKDGWTITDDPLRLSYGGRNVYVDLGAEQPIAAEKKGNKIAVEIKSFIGESEIHDLSQSIGQYNMYKDIMLEIGLERVLWLAIPLYAYDGIFQEPIGQLLKNHENLKILVFDENREEIKQWIP